MLPGIPVAPLQQAAQFVRGGWKPEAAPPADLIDCPGTDLARLLGIAHVKDARCSERKRCVAVEFGRIAPALGCPAFS